MSGANNEKPDPAKVAETALTIGVLQDTIKSLEETKLKLLLNIKELKDKLEQQKSDQADIYYYLNKKCDESFEIIASLEEQLSVEQSDREIAEKMYESKIEELKQTAQNNEMKLMARINEMDNKIEMLSSFSLAKERLEANLQSMEQTLEEERRRFKETTDLLENKFLLEREKLRKSYDIKFENIKKELEASMDGKLSVKTQKTQIMNVVMKKELDTQSRHADRLLEINAAIVEREKKLRIELGLAQSYGEELTKKLNGYERRIKSLNEELEKYKGEASTVEEKYKDTIKLKDEEIQALIGKIGSLTTTKQKQNNQMDDMWEFISSSYHRLRLANQTSGKTRNAVVSYSPDEMLIALVKELAVRFPDQVRQFIDVGELVEAQKEKRQTGIPSWDNPKPQVQEKKEKPIISQCSVAVQTEDTSFIFPAEMSSSWLQQGSVDSSTSSVISRQSKWQMRHDIDGLSVGIHSVPTVLPGPGTNQPSIDGESIASSINEYEIKSARSHSHVLPPKRPNISRNEFIAKNRVVTAAAKLTPLAPLAPFSADSYSSSDNYRLQENSSLPQTRRVQKIRNPVSHSLDDGLNEAFNNIRISGKKFAGPLLLPKIH